MSKTCLQKATVLAALLSLVLTAQADLVIKQEVTGAAGTPNDAPISVVSYFRGDKARVDVSDQVSTIVDSKSGKLTNLVHDQKMVMTMDGKQMQAVQQQVLKAIGKNSPEADTGKAAELMPTGRKETINGFATEEFTSEHLGGVTHLWLARDYPNQASILASMAAFQNSDAFKHMSAIRNYDVAMLPGIPVRVVSDVGGITTTMTLVSVEERDVDPSLFEIPEGYQSLGMPSMGDLLKKLPGSQ